MRHVYYIGVFAYYLAGMLEEPPKKDECVKRDCLADVDELLAALVKFPEVTRGGYKKF